MKKTGLPLWVLAVGVAVAAEPAANPLLSQGKGLVEAAFTELSGALLRAIGEGGVTNAIEFCSDRAMPLTRTLAADNGVELRRVSHRPRNPDNRANDREHEVIREFRQTMESGAPLQPVVEFRPDGSSVFFAPIVLNNPLCLNCHGEPGTDVAQETLDVIQSHYPNDEATGFKLNDVRGLWRIDFPPADD